MPHIFRLAFWNDVVSKTGTQADDEISSWLRYVVFQQRSRQPNFFIEQVAGQQEPGDIGSAIALYIIDAGINAGIRWCRRFCRDAAAGNAIVRTGIQYGER